MIIWRCRNYFGVAINFIVALSALRARPSQKHRPSLARINWSRLSGGNDFNDVFPDVVAFSGSSSRHQELYNIWNTWEIKEKEKYKQIYVLHSFKSSWISSKCCFTRIFSLSLSNNINNKVISFENPVSWKGKLIKYIIHDRVIGQRLQISNISKMVLLSVWRRMKKGKLLFFFLRFSCSDFRSNIKSSVPRSEFGSKNPG